MEAHGTVEAAGAPDAAGTAAAKETSARSNNTVIAAAALVGVAVIASAAIVSVSWLKSAQSQAAVALVTSAPKTPETVPKAPESPLPDAPPSVAELVEPPSDEGRVLTIEELVRQSMPAVVKVETPTGTGSGFFVSNDTLITNWHVVRNEKSVTIRLMNGVKRTAQVEKTYDVVDIAILKADIVDIDQVALQLGRPADVRIGAEVIAIGAPLGLENTVTRGIVSSRRNIVDPYMNTSVQVIQTDAAINPGNSGGPLIDRYGKVIGVNTLKIGGRAESLGFAVSVHYARPLLGESFALKSEDDQKRENGVRRYDDNVRRLAIRADEVEERWKKFRGTCLKDAPEQPVVREWFVLSDGDQGRLSTAPSCASWKPIFLQWASSMREALARYAESAAAAGVPAAKMRSIRKQYNMVWEPWER